MRRLLIVLTLLGIVGAGVGIAFWLLGTGHLGTPSVSITGISLTEVSPSVVTLEAQIAVDNPNPVGATLTSLDCDAYFNRDGGWTNLATGHKENITVAANGRTTFDMPIEVDTLGASQALWEFLLAQGSIDIRVEGTACVKVGPISPCIPFTYAQTVSARTPAGIPTPPSLPTLPPIPTLPPLPTLPSIPTLPIPTPPPLPTLPPIPTPVLCTLEVGIEPTGCGMVVPPGGPFLCGTDVMLTAFPAPFYRFDYWSGDISGTSPVVSVSMDKEVVRVTAHFKSLF